MLGEAGGFGTTVCGCPPKGGGGGNFLFDAAPLVGGIGSLDGLAFWFGGGTFGNGGFVPLAGGGAMFFSLGATVGATQQIQSKCTNGLSLLISKSYHWWGVSEDVALRTEYEKDEEYS